MKMLRAYFVFGMVAILAQAANAVPPVAPNVAVPSVPEPGTVAMMIGMGVAGALMLRRRRK